MSTIKAEKKYSRHGVIGKRAIKHGKANDEDIIAEMRLLTYKNVFYGRFLSNNLAPFFEIYRQLLNIIKTSLKPEAETPQYDIKKDTLLEFINKYNKTIQDNESGDKEIREMFDENEVAEYGDNDYDYEG